jgi:hypothetical protein
VEFPRKDPESHVFSELFDFQIGSPFYRPRDASGVPQFLCNVLNDLSDQLWSNSFTPRFRICPKDVQPIVVSIGAVFIIISSVRYLNLIRARSQFTSVRLPGLS